MKDTSRSADEAPRGAGAQLEPWRVRRGEALIECARRLYEAGGFHRLDYIRMLERAAAVLMAEPPDPEEVAPPLWQTPTEIAARLGTSPQAVGRAICQLDFGDAPWARRERERVRTHPRGPDVTVYEYGLEVQEALAARFGAKEDAP